VRISNAKHAALLAALLAAACTKGGPASEEEPPTPSSRTQWVKVRSSEGVPLLEAPAQVLPSPEGNAAVAPPYRARVLSVLVRPGEKVRKGQPLVEVVMPEVSAAAGQYAAASTRVEAQSRRKAQLDSLKQDGLVRLSDVIEADTKLAEARADQQTAAATLRTAQVDPAEAADIVAGKKPVALRSPIEGVVTAVNVGVGDSREPGAEAVVRVAGQGHGRVEAKFARAVDTKGAVFELVTGAGVRYPVTFAARAPIVDPRDGTIAYWFTAPDKEPLPAGLTGRLVMTLQGAAEAAVVPTRAVALSGGQAHVVARREGKAGKVPVEVIASSGAESLVAGIAPGEEVAADAALAELPAQADGKPEGNPAEAPAEKKP
jgi:multidrug efflux pump subunit AcrA (membrane-fusion protein)